MNYENNVDNLEEMIYEARKCKISVETAKQWANDHIAGMEYEDVKDIAFHMNVPSVEVAHHSTVKSQLVKRIVKKILK